MSGEFQDAISIAQGYFELGMFPEAEALLKRYEDHPPTVDLIHLRILLKFEQELWEEGEIMGREAIRAFPHRAFGYILTAYALHEQGMTAGAHTMVQGGSPTADREERAVMEYNRACYLAVLGRKEEAMLALSAATDLDGSLWEQARKDPDLKSVRNLLGDED